METTQTLQMRFVTQAGTRVTISLDNPRDDLTEAEVTAAMDQIIAKNIFSTSGGDLVAKDSAQIIDRTVNVIYEA
ncbi:MULTISPECIES: DUF2922 domain-containing protein [Eubacteriales]|uniref:DUF2922 domain-containing protein n=2 Tax=Eubacteriales TaxID=186802 RepID=A0A1S6IZQ8_9FIRM|nr:MULTISPECIES: DUF2922 domain-containing protein [Eubacteriales]AQS60256.1 hypothetical protein B0537_14940 [Desulforamulus ferrireducens]TYO92801.1 Protein of unknown function (DUF2922) [Desulfallas thermosapovorans DSM 6562]